MYYNIFKFPVVHVGLRKTITNIIQLVRKKKMAGENPEVLNCLTNRHPDCKM